MKLHLNNIMQEYPAGAGVNRILEMQGSMTLEGPSINMLMGRSGCGKSTLLRMLGGVRPQAVKTPSFGTIMLEDGAENKEVTDCTDDAVMVFLERHPDTHVRTKLAANPFIGNAVMRRLATSDADERVREIATDMLA